MSFFGKVSKRKRIESLVKKSIEDGAPADGFRSMADRLIINLVKDFTEKWPRKYFDIADDRKVAGLVLAYMMEIAEIGVHHVNDHGYALLKLTAEVDLEGFRENTPRTFEFLRRINMVGSEA
jgi:hypothetical protein